MSRVGEWERKPAGCVTIEKVSECMYRKGEEG
jgi:hypothetical protein